jgi:site-specific recombinase XerD
VTTLPALAQDQEVQDNDAIGHMPQALRDAVLAAMEFAKNDKADSTRRAYASDFRDFASWSSDMGQEALPALPGTVAAYLATLVDRKLRASTIRRRLAAIRHAHVSAGHDAPTESAALAAVHAGIRRKIGTRTNPKAPLVAKQLAALLKRTPDNLTGIRDRALLQIGFGAALRRSEIVGVNIDDIEDVPGQGILVHVRRSKTDQEGAGHTIPVPNGAKLKPAEAVRTWIKQLGRTEGPLFVSIPKGQRLTVERLSDRSVANIIKSYAEKAKLDPAIFSGHSLRAGIITSALQSGADVFAAADLARHKKLETTRVYDRRAKAFDNHAGKKVL